MIQIETDRLIIRDHVADDFDEYHRWLSDEDVMKYIIFGKSSTVERSMIMFSEALEGQLSSNRIKYFLVVSEKKSAKTIGECGIIVHEKKNNGGIGEIGYSLFKEFWRKGYATEIANRLIEYCFDDLKLHKVVAHCDAENHASEQVMIHCGMAKEGEIKKCRYANGVWKDELQYALIKEANL